MVPITELGNTARGSGLKRKDHGSALGHVEFEVPLNLVLVTLFAIDLEVPEAKSKCEDPEKETFI